MLSGQEIRKKLYDQAGMFRNYMQRKEYLNAALCVDWAEMAALFVEMDEKDMLELFGTRQTDEPVTGLIREEEYLKASGWCVFHGYAHSRHTYQNVMRGYRKSPPEAATSGGQRT